MHSIVWCGKVQKKLVPSDIFQQCGCWKLLLNAYWISTLHNTISVPAVNMYMYTKMVQAHAIPEQYCIYILTYIHTYTHNMYTKIYKRQSDSNASSLTPYISFYMNNNLISEAPEYSLSHSTNHNCIARQMAAPVVYRGGGVQVSSNIS